MKAKKYTADTMQEAVLKVKSDLGSDAIILHTRKFKTGGFLGLFAKKKVEVVATVDSNKQKVKNTKKRINKSLKNRDEVNSNKGNAQLKEELAQMKATMKDLMGEVKKNNNNNTFSLMMNPTFEKIVESLWSLGLSRATAKDLAQRIVRNVDINNLDDSKFKEVIREELKQELNEIKPIILEKGETKVVSLIGPTGVGKTTTLAKLAARFSLLEGKEVALITVDTYRIAAVEQLKTYSEIINLPLTVAFTPQELNDAIDKYQGYDLILVDTAGRSQNNQVHISELEDFINKAAIDEIYLVLSATTKANDMLKVIDVYSQVDIDKLIITKLDETDSLGTIIEAFIRANKPLSYITVGQDVPEDIRIPESNKLLDNIVKGL